MAFRCDKCNRDFENERSLEQHKSAKHYEEGSNKKTSGLNKKHVVYISIILILLAASFWGYSYATGPGKYDDFAKCLTGKGVKFYGAFWCQHCATQKAMFGKSAKYIDYIECSTSDRRSQVQICIDAGIETYPTWEFPDGTKETGTKELGYLSLKSGCALEPA